ncbi:MAG: glycine cleavage system aminomethyltransferase GcvT [Candidatus Krumholzibacteria bacterium]|nr:glycine cleavage system aminomethyltransferase GcvT [Candidatus Krumholzibacteria bacterium]
MENKKTPLYDAHVRAGGRIVPFAGFLMPVSFEGIVAEHARVRTAVGLFDVSHMGEISITGPGAVAFTDRVVTNNVAKLAHGQICYTVACNEKGTVLDDLLVYRFSDDRILLVVNAVNVDKIFRHLKSLEAPGVEIRDLTAATGQIAVQGPRSRELLMRTEFCRSVRDALADLRYYRFVSYTSRGEEIVLSRTGYTGELGFEIYLPAGRTMDAWEELLSLGKDLGVGPIGLGARDTLRFEPCLCLYGHELDEETSPLEAGLSWLVKLNKADFLGRSALLKEKERGPARVLAGFELSGRQIARQGFSVLQNGTKIGAVTSGTFAPTLEKSLALALISSAAKAERGGFAIDVRGKAAEATMTPVPFYKSRAMD